MYVSPAVSVFDHDFAFRQHCYLSEENLSGNESMSWLFSLKRLPVTIARRYSQDISTASLFSPIHIVSLQGIPR